jgi:hypothetical protein
MSGGNSPSDSNYSFFPPTVEEDDDEEKIIFQDKEPELDSELDDVEDSPLSL